MRGSQEGFDWAATWPNAVTITPGSATAPRPLLVPEPVISPALAHQTGANQAEAEPFCMTGRPAPADGRSRAGAGNWLGRLGGSTLAPRWHRPDQAWRRGMSMSEAAPRATPLRAVHEGLGATMTAFAGWLMPLRYAGEISEHRSVRDAAGLFDLSHLGAIAVTGPQAPAALDYALVGHMSAVAPGRAKYTMICAPDGGILDDLIVYRLSDAEYLVVANAANTGTVAAAL